MTLPKTMQAMVLTGHGDLDMLVFHEDWPVPAVGGDDVLIKVGACGLNNTDINTRTAWYSKSAKNPTTGAARDYADDEEGSWSTNALTFPRIQGADVAGQVVAVGANGDQSLIGKRVLIDTWMRDWNDPLNLNKCSYYGSERDGGYAEYTTADRRNVHPIESDLSDAELATFATSYITAENMLNRAQVQAGDTVLIPGASGGVGGALIQLANRRGARTIAMASENKHADVQKYAPDRLLGRAPENLPQLLTDETVTVVADVVAGPQWQSFINALERGGRYTCAGAIAGADVDFDIRTFYLRDLVFTGATIVPPGTFADLVGYIERGEIKPILAGTYPLSELREAQTAFMSKKHTGNLVVTP